MKKLWIHSVFAVICLAHALPAPARHWEEVSKEKKVHKQYTVSDMDKLEVDNVHGRVHINTWDKNEITVDVTVTAKARSESDAQEILDRVNIVLSDEDAGHRVVCKTVLEHEVNNITHGQMQIDYMINAPKKNALDITNKFGDVYVGDCSGKIRINVSYGALDMQNITGSDDRIKVAFGSAMISSIDHGIFDISYSNLSIDRAGDIEVTNKFGKTDVTSVKNLRLEQKYGNVELGTVGVMRGELNYANVDIDNLQKSGELTLKYCGKAEIRSVGPDVDLLTMEAHYSNLFFHLAEGANLSVDVTARYGNVKASSFSKSMELVREGNKEDWNTTRYRGRAGKGDGRMTIEAHYSNINFK